MLLALLLAAPAIAYHSDSQPIALSDTAVLFSGSTVDTGWVPSGSPITVRFQIESDGGAAVDMAGAADLSWPDALSLMFTGEPGSGALTVDAALAAVTSVQFDVFGYTWDSEIDRRSVGVTGETAFDPFAMDGAALDQVVVHTAGAATEVVSYSYDVFAGVSLNFTADLQPDGMVGYHGVSWTLDDGSEITTEGATGLIAPSGEATQEVSASLVGEWTSALDLTLTPTASVCVPIFGCTDLASFDIPLNLASDDFEQAAPANLLSFPLPVLSTPALSYDLGEVLVGDLVNLPVPISDGGGLDLSGEAGLTGSTYFSLFPSTFLAAPDTEDGVMVTFAPESEGPFAATLLLTSNDPNQPTVEIALTGTGVVPDSGQDTGGSDNTDGKIISSEVGGCGCATGGSGVSGALALLAASAALLRRRRI